MNAALVLKAGLVLTAWFVIAYLIVTRTDHWAVTAAWTLTLPLVLVVALTGNRQKKRKKKK